MENKTPELYAFIDKMDSELGDVWASDRDCLANVLDTYASLQCAEMKEENERLKTDLLNADSEIEQWKDSVPHKALIRQNRELQEEVERLKGVLKESKDTILYLVSEYANGTSMAAEETLTSINRTLR